MLQYVCVNYVPLFVYLFDSCLSMLPITLVSCLYGYCLGVTIVSSYMCYTSMSLSSS